MSKTGNAFGASRSQAEACMCATPAIYRSIASEIDFFVVPTPQGGLRLRQELTFIM